MPSAAACGDRSLKFYTFADSHFSLSVFPNCFAMASDGRLARRMGRSPARIYSKMALSVDMRGGERPKPPGRELFVTLETTKKRAFIYSGGYYTLQQLISAWLGGARGSVYG